MKLPDLIAHLAVGYLASGILRSDKALVLLGSILPDIKIASFLLAPLMDDATRGAMFYALDAPVIFLPLALIGSAFFANRKMAFGCLSLGILLHLALDSMQYKFGGGILPLFPLDVKRYSLGFFWQDDYTITVALVTIVAAYLAFRRCKRAPAGSARKSYRH